MKKGPVNVHEAKTHLSRLLRRVARGEEVVIARAGKPVARLVPFAPPKPAPRPLGLYKGQIWMAPDFDETPKEFMDAWNESIERPLEPPA